MKFLRLPECDEINDLDSPDATIIHSKIIKKKVFLKNLYIDFYRQIENSVTYNTDKIIVEIGSGGGFIKEIMPNIVTSDVMELPGIDKVFSAVKMPFKENSIDAFVMINVLHHISDPKSFFQEASRCLKNKGKILMIEPANTLMARFIYKYFHHEHFDVKSGWGFEETGPLSNANGAIPWIIFDRDRKQFDQDFPDLKIVKKYNHTPFRYLLSGGFSIVQLVPSFTYPLIKLIEYVLNPFNDLLGMFQTIEIEKV